MQPPLSSALHRDGSLGSSSKECWHGRNMLTVYQSYISRPSLGDGSLQGRAMPYIAIGRSWVVSRSLAPEEHPRPSSKAPWPITAEMLS